MSNVETLTDIYVLAMNILICFLFYQNQTIKQNSYSQNRKITTFQIKSNRQGCVLVSDNILKSIQKQKKSFL